jgi:hypothetical protein
VDTQQVAKIWPNQNEKQLGWTATYPRPTEAQGHHPAVLTARQAEWDVAEAQRVKYAKLNADIAVRNETERQQQREKQQAEANARQQARREADEAMLHRRFVSAGGTEAEWAAEKDEVIREHRRRQVVDAETAGDRVRRENAARYRAGF